MFVRANTLQTLTRPIAIPSLRAVGCVWTVVGTVGSEGTAQFIVPRLELPDVFELLHHTNQVTVGLVKDAFVGEGYMYNLYYLASKDCVYFYCTVHKITTLLSLKLIINNNRHELNSSINQWTYRGAEGRPLYPK